MKQIKFVLLMIILLIFSIFPTLAFAQEEAESYVLINSDNWVDVYSGMLYANLKSTSAKFLISDVHSKFVLKSFPQGSSILVIESADSPYIVNVADTFETLGLTASQVIKSSDTSKTNLQLAKMTGTNSFIIVDDSYGYNALAVAPYASLTNSYVLFADESNIREVSDFLDDVGVDNLILYGTLDRAVRDTLAKYNPETINTGNRFDDNIEIVKRHRQVQDNTQIMLSNGEFIEESLMSGGANHEPVLFVGRNNVPDQVMEYLKTSGIKVGVLVGNELLDNAKTLKDNAKIGVFVKFAQGTAVEGTFEEIRDLETFRMPSYELGISIENIKYNTKTKQLEIIYNNERDMIVYFKGTYDIMLGEAKLATIGDQKPVFLDEGETLGVAYNLDISSELAAATEDEELLADVYLIYGESARSMEHVMSGEVPIEFIDIEDNSEMKTNSVSYDNKVQRFIVEVENIGAVDAYANPNLIDLTVNDVQKNIGSAEPTLIRAGQIAEIKIKQRMDDVDLADNEQVHVITYFGERKDMLLNQDEGTFDLNVTKSTNMTAIAVVVVVIVVVLLVLFLFFRKKKTKKTAAKK